MRLASLPKRLTAAALCALVLAAGGPSWARGAVVSGTPESASGLQAASAPIEGSMFNALNTRQQACYQALEAITLAGAQTAPDHMVPVTIAGVTGASFAGTLHDGEFTAASSSVQREYEAMRNDLMAAIIALRYDRPDMLWLDGAVSGVTDLEEQDGTVSVTGVYYEFELPYEGREEELHTAMMAAARSVAERAEKRPDTYSKVLEAHNIIAANATYEHTPDSSLAELLTHSGYSALIPGDEYEPVCDGYSRAFKLVMDELNIPCVLVSSEGHMWNNVLMDDGFWYNVDLTWDDGMNRQDTSYLLVGSHTLFGGQRFCEQTNHIEMDPFAEAGLTVEGLIYPVKSAAAYKYLGRDYATPTPSPTLEPDESPAPSPSATPDASPTAGPTAAPAYPDVGPGHWAYEDIIKVSGLGYFYGDSQGRFNPETPMTRAQFAQVMANRWGEGLDDYENFEQIYPDVKPGAWYAPAVAWAHWTGLMLGDGNGFRPNDPLSRQEMCVALYRALGLNDYWDESFKFNDHDSIAGWARNQVYACYQAGLIKGDANGNFDPQADTKRCQAAAIFARYAEME